MGGISDFRISGQFINENCHNSRTNNDIDMKLGPVTKFDKRSTATLKKFDDDFMSTNCDVIVTFQIVSQSGAILNNLPKEKLEKTKLNNLNKNL